MCSTYWQKLRYGVVFNVPLFAYICDYSQNDSFFNLSTGGAFWTFSKSTTNTWWVMGVENDMYQTMPKINGH